MSKLILIHTLYKLLLTKPLKILLHKALTTIEVSTSYLKVYRVWNDAEDGCRNESNERVSID